MKKSVTKIMKATIAVAMAIGASVGAVSSNRGFNKVVADSPLTIPYNASWDDNGTSGTGSEMNATVSPFTITLNKGYRDTTKTYTQAYANGSFTIAGDATVATIDSISISASGSYSGLQSSGTLTVSGAGTNPTVTGSSTSATITKGATGTPTNSWTISNNKQIRFTQITVAYTNVGAVTINSISVTGSMTKTEYTTVDSWSNAGLTATATYSNSNTGDVTDSATWTYSPAATPAAAVIANSNEEVTGLSVTATATAGGKSGNKSTTGISVNYATVAELTSATPASGTLSSVIAKGIVSQVDEVETTQYFNATYYISDDGTTTGQYEVFHGKGVDNANFTNVNDIQVGDVVVVYGDVTTYKGTKEFGQGNYLLSLDRPVSSEPSITITNPNFTMTVGGDDVAVSADAENIPDGGSIVWESSLTSIATIVNDGGTYKVRAVAAGSATITARILNSASEPVASNSITVTVVENILNDGDSFVIKATYSETDYYLTGAENNLGTVSVTASDAMIFTAVEDTTPGRFQFKNGNKFLKSYDDSKLSLIEDGENADTLWTAVDNGSATIVASVSYATRKLQFNYNNGNTRFACYTNQTAISIEKVVAPEVDYVTVIGNSLVNANGAISVVEDFLYEVTYVDPLNLGDGSVSVTVLNSSDTTDGASVTSAPNGTSFSVTFTASDTYTVTVTSIENGGKSDSTTITISNIYVPPVPVLSDYELYTEDDLVEGDYIIFYDGAAMNNTITSDRAQYEDVEPVAGTISTDDASIIWHIAPATAGYFTIYNSEAGEYLASTGAKNKAQLLADGSDNKSLWSVEVDEGTFEFTNKQNTTNDVNAILRKNGTYGFACYGSGTGGKLSLYRLNDIDSYLSSANTVVSLTDDILRLGSSIQKSVWNSINATAEITDYGVMIYKTDSEANITSQTPVEDAYRNGVVQPAIARKGNGTAPSLTNATYVFTARVRVSNPNTIFCSASFIVVGGQYYFFNEQHISASQLAS